MTKENKAIIPIEEQPYVVPKNWQWVKGKKIFKSMEIKKPNGKFFYYIDIDSIDNKKQCITNPKKLKVIDAPSRASRKLHEGDTIFSMVRPYLRNIAYIDATLENCIASTGFFVCSPKEKLLPIYFYYLMISEYVVSNFTKQMKGDNSPSIRKSDVENFLYPIAPIEEQKRIVECITEQFSKLDKAKEKIQSVLDSSETRKAAILHKAFTGELTASWRTAHNFSITTWENITLNDIAEYKKGPFGSSIKKSMFVPKGINTYKVYEQGNAIHKNANYGTYYINEEKFLELKSNEVKTGDIIISCAGTIGEVYKLPPGCESGIINQALMRVRLFNNIEEKYFILYFGEVLKGDVILKAKGTAMKNIPPFKVMKAMPIKLPSLEEQREIVRILDDLLTKEQHIVDIAAATLQRIDTMKQAILAKAFRGELGTNDPSEPPAPLTANGDLSC